VRQLVVGFDLDQTLVDSWPGIAATYRALSVRTGVPIDTDAVVTRLGPPLDDELAHWYPPDQVPAMADAYRALYPAVAVLASPACPGAAESFAEVRAHGGRVVVITAKFRPNAELHLEHLGLEADELIGMAWADGKIDAMTAHGVGIYVGDHTADMRAARVAGVTAVGVLTGSHSEAELVGAGADAVLDGLTAFPDLLRRYLGS
jgi:phosphoglycolate phosphatase